MTVFWFAGGAGCGKTFRLMESVAARIEETPLGAGEKVLVLTFMHGSRRRLEERLRTVPQLSGRCDCVTLDSFAWRIARRWRSLCKDIGFRDLEPGEFERVIDAAGGVLEFPVVGSWVAKTFPILVLDEAQDLDGPRLRIIRSLSAHLDVFAAADEFQCLRGELRPNPACCWLEEVGECEVLGVPKRTNQAELLESANALRTGQAPRSGRILKIQAAPNSGFAGSWISNQIGWYGRGKTIAVVTSVAGRYAYDTLEWVRNRLTTQGNGPYSIQWERADAEAIKAYLADLAIDDGASAATIRAAVDAVGDRRVAGDVSAWIERQRRVLGKEAWLRAEVDEAVKQSFYLRRKQGHLEQGARKAMTIHGAKNREFDMVVVLWPGATIGSDDQKRRLLYNAITRAKERCLILVQVQAQLLAPPFA